MHNDFYQSAVITTASTTPVVSLVEARRHLRNEELTVDDDYVEALVGAATSYVEKQYGLALLNKTVEAYYSKFPGNDVAIFAPIIPLSAVETIEYLDDNGDYVEVDSDTYRTGHINGWGAIVIKPNNSWPSVTEQLNAVKITYTAGFGTTSDKVPSEIRHAILLLMADMYVNREDNVRNLPQASTRLLLPWFRHTL